MGECLTNMLNQKQVSLKRMGNEINIWVTLGLLFFHWVADFVFQTDWMATNKSKEWKPLLIHTSTYASIMAVCAVIILPAKTCFMAIPFGIVTFILHTGQDYITSRLNARLWESGKRYECFVSIGLDQLIHFVQLII